MVSSVGVLVRFNGLPLLAAAVPESSRDPCSRREVLVDFLSGLSECVKTPTLPPSPLEGLVERCDRDGREGVVKTGALLSGDATPRSLFSPVVGELRLGAVVLLGRRPFRGESISL